jgi:hypothetical protein
MTRTTNARLAGFTYLFYIAVAFPSMVLFDRATSGNGTAAKLASIARHASDVRVAVVLSLLGCFSALVLAVTLYGITRDEDHELAMLGLTFRVGEGVVGAAGITKVLGLLSLASAGAGAASAEVAAANALGAFLLMPGSLISATFFAVGSTLFSYLLLRGRMVPVPLAWLGVVASVLLTVLLPAQLAGFLKGPLTFYIWMPMLVFEVVLALWLLIKGVAVQATR